MKPRVLDQHREARRSLYPISTLTVASNIENPGAKAAKPSRLWLWFVAAFVIQISAWTAWFIIAAHHKVEDVPLASGARR